MRRAFFPVLMISFVLLCSCAKGQPKEQKMEERFLEFRESIQDCYLMLNAEITADYGDHVEAYTINSRETTEGTDLEVVEPETIRGICATTDGETFSLAYEGVILDVGALTSTGITPLSGLPVLASAMREGHVERCWEETYQERDALAVSLCTEKDTVITLWLDANDLTPFSAELTENGQTVLFYTVTDWSTNA